MSEQTAGPLQGLRILVTRTREQASALSERLSALGALPLEFPTIRIEAPRDWTQLDAALGRLYENGERGYDWLILTSVNGVTICLNRLLDLGYTLPSSFPGVRIATIGPATAAAVARYGLQVDLTPDEYVAEGVVQALLADARQHGYSIAGQRILLARAAEARKILPEELRRAGAIVDEVPAYHTYPVARSDERAQTVLQLLEQRQLDIITFTSSSTVQNFVAWLRSCDLTVEYVSQRTQLASIGPITSETARTLGFRVDIEAQTFTIDGLVEAIVHYERVTW